MADRQTLSVIIPAYNEADRISHQLRGILGQTRAADEVIIVDDCSTDGTASILDYYASHFASVKVFHMPHNIGAAAAMQFGLEQASKDYLFSVAANDVVLPDTFQTAMGLLDAHPGAAMFVSDGMAFTEDGAQNFVSNGYSTYPRFFTPDEASGLNFKDRPIWGAEAIMRRDLINAVGGIHDLASWTDVWLAHVLAIRYGFCYAPIVLNAMREHPRPPRGPEEQMRIQRKVVTLLDQEPPLVRERLFRSGALTCWDVEPYFVQAVFERYNSTTPTPLIKEQTVTPEPEQPTLDLRRQWTIVVAAQDLLDNAQLGQSYAEAFHDTDSVTLVVYAPNADAEALSTQLIATAPAIARNGGPDVLLLTDPAYDADTLAARCQARLGCANDLPAFATLQAFDAAAMPRLRTYLFGGRASSTQLKWPPGLSFCVEDPSTETVRSIAAQQIEDYEIVETPADAHLDYVVMLDSNVSLRDGWYQALLEMNAGFDIATSQVRLPDGGRDWDHLTAGGPAGRRLLEPLAVDPFVCVAHGAAWVARRDVVEAIGYDGQDVEFSRRCQSAGYELILHNPNMVAVRNAPRRTMVGRQVLERQRWASLDAIASHLELQTDDQLVALSISLLQAGAYADAADSLRIGMARQRPDPRLLTLWRQLEGAFGGALSTTLPLPDAVTT